MLRTDLPDHRRASDAELVAALRERDPLALAEAYHRTIPAAHATARRLLSGSPEVEALLRAVYDTLWSDPPADAALEGWIRARCFELAAEDLRERDAAPASPSLTTLLPELPRSEIRYLDAAERALAELDDTQRRALLLAHDKGVPAAEQGDGAERALTAALLALAGPEPGGEQLDPSSCEDVPLLADWVLGLVPPGKASQVSEAAARPECSALVKALRRGRRRLEGLPPTPDMGQRVLVVVLAGAPAPVPAPAPAATPSPAGASAVGAAGMTSALDDTGDLTPPPSPDGEAGQRRPPGDIYAELAELDDEPRDQPLVLSDDEDDDQVAARAASATSDDADDPYDPPRRSVGGRVVIWLLGTLFMLAGIAAGLYLGLTLLR